MNKGHGGFGIKRDGDKVIKSTTGSLSSYYLRRDCFKQLRAGNKLSPIKTVPVISFTEGENSFEMELPYLDYKIAFNIDTDLIKDKILNSLKSRFGPIQQGFKKICLDFLNEQIKLLEPREYKSEALFLAQKIGNIIDEADDYYPIGYNHGDFGLANMLVDENNDIHMIDFTHSFIYTPLIDVATLSLSGIFGFPDHKLTNSIIEEFSGYRNHIRAIRILKMFSWLPNTTDKNPRTQIIKKIEDE